MARASDLQPPAWFTDARYAHLAARDELGGPSIWLTALEKCAALASWSDETWTDRAEMVGIELPRDGRPFTDAFVPAYVARPPVQMLVAADLPAIAADPSYSTSEGKARFGPALLMSVSLDAPDAVILKGLREALAVARRTHPSPVEKPGRRALNGQLAAVEFARWQAGRIVQVAEIDWWATRQPDGRRPRDANRARWIFGEAVDQPNKQLAKARSQLGAAIARIPALYAQTVKPSSGMDLFTA